MNLPASSDWVSVAATDAIIFKGSECAYPPPVEAFSTTGKAAMPHDHVFDRLCIVAEDHGNGPEATHPIDT
jgi:hypothetical protein